MHVCSGINPFEFNEAYSQVSGCGIVVYMPFKDILMISKPIPTYPYPAILTKMGSQDTPFLSNWNFWHSFTLLPFSFPSFLKKVLSFFVFLGISPFIKC